MLLVSGSLRAQGVISSTLAFFLKYARCPLLLQGLSSYTFALAGLAKRMGKAGRRPIGLSARKKPPAKNKDIAFKPVLCQLGFVVKGGFGAGRPHAVDSADFQNENFVKMHKMESWVCHTVAGKAKGLNPLQRTTLLETLARLIDESVDKQAPKALAPAGQRQEEDCMADLGLDGPSLSAAAPAAPAIKRPCSSRASKGPRSRKDRRKAAEPRKCQALTLALPPKLRDGERRSVRVLTRAPTGRMNRAHVWVVTDDVPWVLQVLHRQWASGGLEYLPEPVQQRKPYFQIRDRSWQVRARLPSGEYRRKTFTVPWSVVQPDGRRVFISQDKFAKDKEAMFHKAVAWQAAVEAGFAAEE